VPVLLLSQLNRGLASSTDGRPQLYSLRESGALEQDADLVMLLYRPIDHNIAKVQTGPTAADVESAEGLVELILAKNRNGPTGEAEMYYFRAFSLWADKQPEGRQDGPPQPRFSEFDDYNNAQGDTYGRR
jgi:replicative DNA helicase